MLRRVHKLSCSVRNGGEEGAIDIHSQSPVDADMVYIHGPSMGGSSHG